MNKSDSLESDIKVILEKIKELEIKVQEQHPKHQSNHLYAGQIHTTEDLYEDENQDIEALLDEDIQDEDLDNPLNVEACFAQENMTDTT